MALHRALTATLTWAVRGVMGKALERFGWMLLWHESSVGILEHHHKITPLQFASNGQLA